MNYHTKNTLLSWNSPVVEWVTGKEPALGASMDEREEGAKGRTPILKLFYVKLSAGIKGVTAKAPGIPRWSPFQVLSGPDPA